MECVLCGEGLAEGEACYDIEDTNARYPLCGKHKSTDVRLLLMEREVQGMIDRIAESMEV